MKITLLADLHIGSIQNTRYVYDVLISILDTEVVNDRSDALIILGDYFHRLFKANEEYVSLANNIMSYIVRICRKQKTKVRIVYGTESHEANQYQSLFAYHLGSRSIDMKVITTAQAEELLPGVNVLYIPEEYMMNRDEHYGELLSKHYDYIFGHGVIIEGMPAIIGESSRSEKAVPRFHAAELSDHANLTIFGHQHVHKELPGNVYYLGSLFRNSFGEEEPKGYGVIRDGVFKFVENEAAYVYRSYNFDEDSDVFKSVSSLTGEINRIKRENFMIFEGYQQGKVRLVFHLPKTLDPSFRETLSALVYSEKNISVLMKESLVTQDDVVAMIESEYDFILDKSLPIPDKIYRYIGKNFPELDLSVEELVHLIEDEVKI